MNIFFTSILCFCTAFGVDWCWTKYIKRASEGAALPAALWSVFIYGLGSTGTYIFIKNPWMIIPMTLGYFCGTYYAVRHDHPEKTNEKQ